MIRRALILSVAVLAGAVPIGAQSEPYRVYDTRPVITDGPYLIATGETTATIVWFTDTPSHAKVLYGPAGDLSSVAEPQVDGLVPVGTRHVVHLDNLSPGTTYGYEVAATRVVKLKAYWPDKGLDVRSGPYQFTTFDRESPSVSFSVELTVKAALFVSSFTVIVAGTVSVGWSATASTTTSIVSLTVD